MKKKLLIVIGASATALAMLPLFAAFEAHVVNVTATLGSIFSARPFCGERKGREERN